MGAWATCNLILKWLNNNPGIGIVTPILIATVTWLATLVMRARKPKADRKPELIFTEEIEPGEPYNRAIYVKNTGQGVALNIVRRIESDPLALVAPTETLPLGSLAPGDKTFAFYRTLPSNSAVPILDNPQFHATLECDDIIGGSYESTYRDRHQSSTTPIHKRHMLPKDANRI